MRKQNVRQIIFIIICLFFLIHRESFSQTGREILERYLDTVSNGDVNKWNKIKTMYATSIGYYSSGDFEHNFNLTLSKNLDYKKIFKVWPDHQKEEIYKDSLYNDTPSKFYFLKNKHVIIIGMMSPVETPVIKSVWFDFFPVKIKDYIDKSKTISFVGIKEIPGKLACYEVNIVTKEEMHQLFFNTKTFLLEGIYFPDKDIYWIISDYKYFDGYLIPTYVASVKDGVIYTWEKFKTFVLNATIDLTKFVPPN